MGKQTRYERTELRRDLRSEMPVPEVIVWSRLKGRQLNDLKFRRQHSIGPFVVDFYCAALRLAIELDGESHFESEEAELRDRTREEFITRQGVTVLRFTNYEVGTELEAILGRISEVAEELAASVADDESDR